MFGFTTAKRWNDETAFDAIAATGHTAEMGHAEGMVAGTRIATEFGWRPVEAIAVGDRVMTFDHGPRPVVSVTRTQLWDGQGRCPRHMQPLAVPTGALGNASAMLLLPEQTVLVESDLAEEVFGDPFALIPAAALEGYRGIDRITPHQRVEVIILEFAQDEVIYANGTGMIHCGAANAGSLHTIFDDQVPAMYQALPLEMARSIVAAMIDEDEQMAWAAE